MIGRLQTLVGTCGRIKAPQLEAMMSKRYMRFLLRMLRSVQKYFLWHYTNNGQRLADSLLFRFLVTILYTGKLLLILKMKESYSICYASI